MSELIDLARIWPELLGTILLFGFAPGFCLRIILLGYPRGHDRRRELLAELPEVPYVKRPIWVASQVETALFEGVPARIAELRSRLRAKKSAGLERSTFSLPAVSEGIVFGSLRELSVSGVHRAPQAGIVSAARHGAESIVVGDPYSGSDTGDFSDPSGTVPVMTERPRRPKVPLTGGEREILTSLLDYHRATVAWKAGGLTDEQARRVHLPSELTTVAGLIAHLTLNEWFWFGVVVDGEEDTWERKLEQDPDAEFRVPPGTSVERLLADYEKQCARSREITAARGLDDQVTHKGETFNVRWVVTHMIEETARHVGHLDVLRELTDGLTGE